MHIISFLSDSCNNFSLIVMTWKFSMNCVVVNLILSTLFLRLFHLQIAIFLKFFINSFYTNIAPFYLLCQLYFLYKYFIVIVVSNLVLCYIKYIIITLEFWRERGISSTILKFTTSPLSVSYSWSHLLWTSLYYEFIAVILFLGST